MKSSNICSNLIFQLFFLTVILHYHITIAQNDNGIFEIYSPKGSIFYDSIPETLIEFNSPLLISKKINESVAISFLNETLSQHFFISPEIVLPGNEFYLNLKSNPKDLPFNNETFFNIQIHGMSLKNEKLKENKNLRIEIKKSEKNKEKAFEKVENDKIQEFETEFPEDFVFGKQLDSFNIENNKNIDSFKLFGKYSKIFQIIIPSKKSLILKFIDKKCDNLDEFECNPETINTWLRHENFAELIVQISSNSQFKYYLIKLNRFLKATKKYRLKTIYSEIDLSENAEKLENPIQIEILNVLKNEKILPTYENNLKLNINNVSTIAQFFNIHPFTGLISLKENVNLKSLKLGKNENINIQLIENETLLLDKIEIPINIFTNLKGEITNFPLRFEQSIYAFAVGPKVKNVGKISVINGDKKNSIICDNEKSQCQSSIFYSISEGGSSYFNIEPQTGRIFYEGPLEKSSKNYTIKAMARDKLSGKIDFTSVQILIAGIESSPPKILKKFEAIEINSETLESEQTIHVFKALDTDPDSRLKYNIEDIKCFTVLSQQLKTPCENLFYIGNNGLRNGSLILRNKISEHDENEAMKLLIKMKTNALATVYFNVSIQDSNHDLEPKATSLSFTLKKNSKVLNLAMLILTFSRNKNSTENNLQNEILNKRRFVVSEKEILLNDNLPINSSVYTVFLPDLPRMKKNGVKFNTIENFNLIKYSLLNENNYFMVNKNNGILRTIASLKGLTTEKIEIVAKDFNEEVILDKMTLTFKIKNSSNSVPDFAEKIYKFENFYDEASEFPIGKVEAFDNKPKELIKYELVQPLKNEEDQRNYNKSGLENFSIDKEGKLFYKKRSKNFDDHCEYNFYVKATNFHGQLALAPVNVKIRKNSTNMSPSFRVKTIKVTLMENAPIGSFVADFGAKNFKNITLRPFANSKDFNKTLRLLDVFSVDSETGTIRTQGHLVGNNEFGNLEALHKIQLIGFNGAFQTKALLEINLIPVSKCLPVFDSDQQLIFNIITKPKLNQEIGKIKANIEQDCELHYFFDPLNNYGFAINPETGSISLQTLQYIKENSKEIQKYPLILNAQSGHLITQLGIEIRFTIFESISLNASKTYFLEPKLRFEVAESVEKGYIIGRVLAQQTSKNITYKLIDDDSEDNFQVNEMTGEISIKNALDYENGANIYNLKIFTVSENENSESYAEVIIEVLDVNDNNPQFEHENMVIVLEKNTIIGSVIKQIRAFDADLLTSSLIYSIEKTSFVYKGIAKPTGEIFGIDRHNGILTLKNGVSDFVGGAFELDLKVQDSDIDSDEEVETRSTKNVVKIWICESSDLLSIVIPENPIHLNSTKVQEYLRWLSETAESLSNNFILPVQVLVYDYCYRTLTERGRNPIKQILSDSTVLRVLLVDSKHNTIIMGSNAEKQFKDSKLPDFGLFLEKSSNFDEDLSASFWSQTNEDENFSWATSSNGTLFLGLLIFGMLLLAIMMIFGIIICYHRRKFLREKRFYENARLAQASKGHPAAVANYFPQLPPPPIQDFIYQDPRQIMPALQHTSETPWNTCSVNHTMFSEMSTENFNNNNNNDYQVREAKIVFRQ